MKKIPFDLEKAKAGWPVVTRAGKKVLEIFFCKSEHITSKILTIIEDDRRPAAQFQDGRFHDYDLESEFDLFLLSKTKKLWVAVKKTAYEDGSHYCSNAFSSERLASERLANVFPADKENYNFIEIEIECAE